MMNEIIENSKWGLGDFAQIPLIYFFTFIAFYFLFDLLLRFGDLAQKALSY